MLKVKDLLKSILVEEGIKDEDAYLEGRILDCVVEVSDEFISVTHGSPVPSGMEQLDNDVLYGAWVYSFNEDTLCHSVYCITYSPLFSSKSIITDIYCLAKSGS